MTIPQSLSHPHNSRQLKPEFPAGDKGKKTRHQGENQRRQNARKKHDNPKKYDNTIMLQKYFDTEKRWRQQPKKNAGSIKWRHRN